MIRVETCLPLVVPKISAKVVLFRFNNNGVEEGSLLEFCQVDVFVFRNVFSLQVVLKLLDGLLRWHTIDDIPSKVCHVSQHTHDVTDDSWSSRGSLVETRYAPHKATTLTYPSTCGHTPFETYYVALQAHLKTVLKLRRHLPCDTHILARLCQHSRENAQRAPAVRTAAA